MSVEQWWDLFNKNKEDMKRLVEKFYPLPGKKFDMTITAPGAERMCEQIRKETPQLDRVDRVFDAAVESKDQPALEQLMSSAWFGMPESWEVRSEPGFFVLCELLEGVEE
jgi:hypothetical protein